jgi:ketosteroid isomerase-like protein
LRRLQGRIEVVRPRDTVKRWIQAINEHDIEGIVTCFAEDYEDEAPARPGEVVRGRDQVRANFERLMAAMPDIRAELRGSVAQGDTVWMEWAMRGSRADGTRMEFVGVNVFEVRDGRLQRGRIYTELVREAGGLQAQVERMTTGT